MNITIMHANPISEYKLGNYIGADVGIRRLDFKEGYGDNVLLHNFHQGDIYTGLKFSEYIGLELGFESTVTKARTSTLTAGDILSGVPIVVLVSPVILRSKIKIKGPHIDMVGFYSFCEDSPFKLFGSAGLAFLKGTSERQTLFALGTPRTRIRTLIGRKNVLRMGGGFQYMIISNLGTRLSVKWENTSRMIINSDDGVPGIYRPEIRPKNSIVYGIGFVLEF